MNYPHAAQFFSLAQRFKSLASARNSVVPAFNTKHTLSDTHLIYSSSDFTIHRCLPPSLASSLISERQVLPQAILPPFAPCSKNRIRYLSHVQRLARSFKPLRRAQLQGRALTSWCAQARSKKLSVVMSTWNCRMLEQNKWDCSKR